MEIQLLTLRNAPVFAINSSLQIWKRVYGAIEDKKQKCWYFPAYPPFIDRVLHDLNIVYKGISFNKEAKDWINQQEKYEQIYNKVKNYAFPIKSLTHQLEGTADLIHNYRWALQWEMGTGKSKAVIDAIHYLRCKTLVLVPKIALNNWVNEVKKHTKGALNAIAITSNFKKTLKKAIEGDYDFLIATYGTARAHSIPKIQPTVHQLCKSKQTNLHTALRTVLLKIKDAKTQCRLFLDWYDGRKLQEIREEVDTLTGTDPQWLVDYPYTTIVADESHRIKNIRSMQTSACLDLARIATRRYLLTGTLSHGDPRDLYPQLKFLAPSIIPGDYRKFCNTYITFRDTQCRIPSGYKQIHTLNRTVASICNEKKLKECVDLPDRQFIKIFFELNTAQKKDYNYVVKNWEVVLPEAGNIEIANGAIRINKLLQICSGFVYYPDDMDTCNSCEYVFDCVMNAIQPRTHKCRKRNDLPSQEKRVLRYENNPKLLTLMDTLNDVLNNGKVIIWAQLVQELDDIEEKLKAQKIGYVRVDGSTSNRISEMERKFETDSNCMVYLGQISTGIAITLNAAKYVIYYSRSWSLDQRLQSAARNFRIGQDKKTVVLDLCAKKTVENQQIEALQFKENTAKLLTNRQNCSLCSCYSKCMQNNVLPWSNDCILDKTVTREKTKAWAI